MDQPRTAVAERRTPRTLDFVAFLARENATRREAGKPAMSERDRLYWRRQFPFEKSRAQA